MTLGKKMIKLIKKQALTLISGIALSLLLANNAPANERLPVEAFFKDYVFDQMEISPNGDYLAATVPFEDRTSLVILRRSDMKLTGHVSLEKKAHVESFYWVNPTRILFTTSKREGRIARPYGLGGVYGVNVDGSKQGLVSTADDSVSLLDTLVDDDNYVMVQYGTRSGFMSYGKMNVYNGSVNKYRGFESPIPVDSMHTDRTGKVRFLHGYVSNLTTGRLYLRDQEDAKWVLVNDASESGLDVVFAGFSADEKTAYLISQENTGPDSIYTFDMETHEKKLLLRDDNVDPAGLLSSPVDFGVFAAVFLDGKPRVEFIDKQSPFAKDLIKIQGVFPDTRVRLVSSTKDASLGVYLVTSDRIPGEYYLYDRSSGKASYLAALQNWLKPEALAPMKPISISARDGLALHGFLTLPNGGSTNLPLVVVPHGGPFFVSDSWGYNNEVQLLANRGYAVLQLNFRGSSNYGKEFQTKGYQQWGAAMQDDLTDATHWAIKSGIANPSRICIYGASYGAYAALMGAVREPNLYKCAIGNVGVYDLAKLATEGSNSDWNMKRFFSDTLGTEKISEVSPNKMAGRIKVPVLLAAGDEDKIAPMHHTKAMFAALQRAGVPSEMTIYEKEGHGNYLLVNQVDWANRVLKFLDSHIGPEEKK
jgi:dipeptidyl aminopeptidase/acylaminoacyl peptidase